MDDLWTHEKMETGTLVISGLGISSKSGTEQDVSSKNELKSIDLWGSFCSISSSISVKGGKQSKYSGLRVSFVSVPICSRWKFKWVNFSDWDKDSKFTRISYMFDSRKRVCLRFEFILPFSSPTVDCTIYPRICTTYPSPKKCLSARFRLSIPLVENWYFLKELKLCSSRILPETVLEFYANQLTLNSKILNEFV